MMQRCAPIVSNYHHFQALLVFFGVLFSLLLSAEERRIRVAYLADNHPGFWSSSYDFIEQVAEDLNINLHFHVIDTRFSSLRVTKKLINSQEKPDYLIYHYQEEGSAEMLRLAEEAGIRSFIFNTGIPKHEREQVGFPRSKYKHWIGHIYSDDRETGYRLADQLVQMKTHTHDSNASEPILMAALSEWERYLAVVGRVEGLRQRVGEDPLLTLKPIIRGLERFEKAVEGLLKRYQDISMIWATSDTLALEAINVGKAVGRKLGEDLFIGGVDGTTPALEAVLRGDMAVTMGGHFMESGWALVLLHDYHFGIDFEDELGLEIHLPMLSITGKNVEAYARFYDDKEWHKIDFKRFSKHYTQSLKKYDFSTRTVMKMRK